MQGKIEVRWHGRGGQGAVTASRILAEAALASGKFVQAFPEFGPERAGAPVKSFTRISANPINTHVQITAPDAVVVLDSTLLGIVDVSEGLSKEGVLIVNTQKAAEELRKGFGTPIKRIATLDATAIAIKEFKRNIPNTSMIAALIKVTGILRLEDIIEGFKKQYSGKFNPEVLEANIRAMKAAYDEVRIG